MRQIETAAKTCKWPPGFSATMPARTVHDRPAISLNDHPALKVLPRRVEFSTFHGEWGAKSARFQMLTTTMLPNEGVSGDRMAEELALEGGGVRFFKDIRAGRLSTCFTAGVASKGLEGFSRADSKGFELVQSGLMDVGRSTSGQLIESLLYIAPGRHSCQGFAGQPSQVCRFWPL